MKESPARDWRMWIGVLFLVGYYLLAFTLLFVQVPEKNLDLVNNMLVTLGPPVGMIVGALFRTDRVEEQRTENTGKAMDAMKAQAEATAEAAKAGTGGATDGAIYSGDTVTIDAEENKK